MAHQFEANTEGAVLQESQEIERKGTSTTKKFWLRPSEDIEPEGLLPDHDLMKRFQIALKNHLQRQNERLSEEVLELDGDIRKKNKEHIDLEETLRTMQQEVTKQKDQLLNYHESLSQTKKMRADMEQKVQNSKSHHLVDSDKLRKQQKKEFCILPVSSIMAQFCSIWKLSANSSLQAKMVHDCEHWDVVVIIQQDHVFTEKRHVQL